MENKYYFSEMEDKNKPQIPKKLIESFDPVLQAVYAEFFDGYVRVVYDNGLCVDQNEQLCVVNDSMFPIRPVYYQRN